MLACESARFEYRAWAATFPELPQPEGEPWREETYLLPPHLASRNVKIRDGALEIKELVSEKDGMQSWHPAAKLEFPIAASALERELLLLLHLGIVLEREVYGPWPTSPRRATTWWRSRCASGDAATRWLAAGRRLPRSRLQAGGASCPPPSSMRILSACCGPS